MLSFLDMAEGSEVPEHSHPHEQAGLVLSGELQFRIGSEEKDPKTRGSIHCSTKCGAFRCCCEGTCTRP